MSECDADGGSRLKPNAPQLLELRCILERALGGESSLVRASPTLQRQQCAHEFFSTLVDVLGSAVELRSADEALEPDEYNEEQVAQMKQWEHELTEANERSDGAAKQDILMQYATMQWGCDRIRLRSELGPVFQGQRVVTTSCQEQECRKFTASRADPFICEEIRLRRAVDASYISSGSMSSAAAAVPLTDLLEVNARPQRPDAFVCEGCNACSSTVVEDKLLRLPEVFVVHINRADKLNRRIETSVDFPDSLDLGSILLSPDQPYDSRMQACASSYVLQAVCFHQGQSARLGHYFAAIRDAHQPGRWWEVSDAWCSELRKHPREVETILSGPRSSLLFYVRDGVEE